MAGNFWQSSHCKQWLLEPHEIRNEFIEKDKKIVGGEENYRKLMILYANVIQSIGEQLKLRQQVIATATGTPRGNSCNMSPKYTGCNMTPSTV